MNKQNELVIAGSNVGFLKKLSFWMFLLIVLNISIFFAFTQDFYFQRYYSKAQNLFILNEQYYKDGIIGINSEVNKRVSDINNVDYNTDCDYISSLLTQKKIEPYGLIKYSKSEPKIKNPEMESIFTNYYTEVDKLNLKIQKINTINDSLYNLSLQSKLLTNICINYYRLNNSSNYSSYDNIVIKRLPEQLAEFNTALPAELDYTGKIGLARNLILSKEYNLERDFVNQTSSQKRNERKEEMVGDYKAFLIAIMDVKTLANDLDKQKINENVVDNYKKELVAKVNDINTRGFWNNVLKISVW
jgi:hypothetical protein